MDHPLSRESLRAWEDLALRAGTLPTQDAAWALAAIETLPGTPSFLDVVTDNEVEALAPLVRRGGTLELAGSRELGEPSDLLALTPDALQALVERLASSGEAVLLHRLPADSPTLPALQRAYRRRGWLQVAEATSNPTITLNESWEEPGGGLSSSRRSALRRSRKKAEKLAEVSVELLAPTPEQVDELLDQAFQIEARSWKGEEGAAVSQVPYMDAFFRRYARELAERQALRIDLLRIGGRGAAMQIGARWKQRHWLFKIGYDASFRAGSPGQLLLAESVAAAARDGLESYELLGSRADWTDAWTKQLQSCVTVSILPRSARGMAAFGTIQWRRAQRRLRRRMIRTRVGIVNTASEQYVAGQDLGEALAEEARYAAAGHLTTVGYWNGRDDSPSSVAEQARTCAEALREGSEVSLKLVPFGGDGPALDELMALCDGRGLTLHFDALQPEAASQTRDAALRLSERWPGRVGCTLAGRWARCLGDAEEIRDSGIRVRLVKGEVEDRRGEEVEMSEGFLALTEALAGGSCHVEVATQDAALAERSLRALLDAGTSCELQVLHAMRSAAALRVAHRLDVPVRVYIPYGTGRLPYTKETIQRHPTMAFSFARDLLPLPPRRPAIWTAHMLPLMDQLPF